MSYKCIYLFEKLVVSTGVFVFLVLLSQNKVNAEGVFTCECTDVQSQFNCQGWKIADDFCEDGYEPDIDKCPDSCQIDWNVYRVCPAEYDCVESTPEPQVEFVGWGEDCNGTSIQCEGDLTCANSSAGMRCYKIELSGDDECINVVECDGYPQEPGLVCSYDDDLGHDTCRRDVDARNDCGAEGEPCCTGENACDSEYLRCNPDNVCVGTTDNVAFIGCDNESEGDIAACEACVGYPPNETGNIWTELGCLDPSPAGIITRMFQIAFGILGGVGILRIMQIAVLYQSQDQEKIKEAKDMIFSLFAGMILLLASIVILKFLGVNVLGLPEGFLGV